MLKLDKLLLIFVDPKRFLNGLLRYFDWLILDQIFRLFSILIFGLCPQYLYLLCGKTLVRKKERWRKRDNPEDDWIYKDEKKISDEINIVCRGTSLKQYLKKINKKIPTFFINFVDSFEKGQRGPKQSKKVPQLKLLKIFFKHSNFYGSSSGGFTKKIPYLQIDNFSKGIYPSIVFRHGVLAKEKKNKILWSHKKNPYPDINYLKKIDSQLPKRLKGTYKIYEKKKLKFSKKNKRIIKSAVEKGLIHSECRNEPPFGAALGIIFILGSSSKKVNIYGWDHYLKKDVDKYNYWKLIKAMSNKDENLYDLGPWTVRCKAIFAEAIWNLHYADRLIKHKKYKIFSRLSKIHKQKKLLKNIEKIMFVNN